MPLQFQPKVRSVLMCDFQGFVLPEMVKVRPVVILARNPYNSKLVTIVPLSTTEPDVQRECHHKLMENPLPDKQGITCWAKCDMVTTISTDRLDRYKTRGPGGRVYVVPSVSAETFEAIKQAVLCGMGMRYLVQ